MTTRVARTHGVIYSKPRRCAKRRRCDGHLALPHHIEPGSLAIWSALPPRHPEFDNLRWQRHAFCIDCAPIEVVPAGLPDPEPSQAPAWRDRFDDVWREGDDGLMHSAETAPFSREHVERKWGPLTPVPTSKEVAL